MNNRPTYPTKFDRSVVVTQLTLYDTHPSHELARDEVHSLLIYLYEWDPWDVDQQFDALSTERDDLADKVCELESELEVANDKIVGLENPSD